MRTSPLLPLAAVFALAVPTTLPAQIRHVHEVLLVRFGAGDLVLNQPLIDTLLSEPGLTAKLREALGASFSQAGFTCETPAAHLPGTFQVHVRGSINCGQWNDEVEGAVIEAVVGHLRQRLQFLLCDEPRHQLTQRRDELRRRCADLVAARSARTQSLEAAAARVDVLRQQQAQLEQQLLASRLELATEDKAKLHLERAANEHRSRLEHLQEVVRKQADKRNELSREAAALDARLMSLGGASADSLPNNPNHDEITRVRDALVNLRSSMDQFQQELELHQARCDEQRRLLTVTLEQWPALVLTLERCKARAQGIEEQMKAIESSLDAARKELADARAAAEQTEEMTIDLTVCRSLLNEVQGKLARLEPVRIEAVRQR